MNKTMNKPIDASVDEQPRRLSYAQIRSMYFDAVIDQFIRTKYPKSIGWDYDYNKSPVPLNKQDFVRVAVSFDESKTFINVNLRKLFDTKASESDVLFVVESKTNIAKKLYEECLMARENCNGMTAEVNVADYTQDEIKSCVQYLNATGIEAVEDDIEGILLVSTNPGGGSE